MKNAQGATIYVGKARSLRNRVRSYFTGEKDIKTRFLLANMADIEVIITNTEYEALILENNLIKQHAPAVQHRPEGRQDLPGDPPHRGGLSPRLSHPAHDLRRLGVLRPVPQAPADRSVPSAHRAALSPLQVPRVAASQRAYPCLNYHMGRCSGACCGKITREDYVKIVDGVRKLLSGRSVELLRELTEKMKAASAALEFERAARLRDQIRAIEEVSVEQGVMEFTRGGPGLYRLRPVRGGHGHRRPAAA